MEPKTLQFFSARTYPLRSLFALSLMVGLILYVVSPVLQLGEEAAFIHFADHRSWLGIPNFLDSFSNIGFLIVGAAGLRWGWRRFQEGLAGLSPTFFLSAGVFALSMALTALGSTYFHLHPSHESLFWDRLPMVLGFASTVSILFADRVDAGLAKWLLMSLLAIGGASLYAWQINGFANPYSALQAGTLIAIFLIAFCFPKGHIPNPAVMGSLALYIVAKLFELGDHLIFDYSHFVSGHTLKHLAASVAVFMFWKGIEAAVTKEVPHV